MDDLVSTFNGLTLLTMSALALWLAIDPRFQTRVVITAGLSLVCIGSGVLGGWHLAGPGFDAVEKFSRAVSLLNTGVFTVLVGYTYRAVHRSPPPGVPRRRSTDFGIFDQRPHHHTRRG